VLSPIRRAVVTKRSDINYSSLVPSLIVLNAAALSKPLAIDHLAVDLKSYDVDVGVISVAFQDEALEQRLQSQRPNSVPTGSCGASWRRRDSVRVVNLALVRLGLFS